MNEKILFVDDDANLLAACQRGLRKHFAIDTANCAQAGLRMIQENGPYAIVVSDMRMPLMDGVRFLSLLRETTPQTVRIMLTGNADVASAIGAVNEGHVFRFITKPCTADHLIQALRAGLEQYRLQSAEKELLEQTVMGSISLLTDVLSVTAPKLFGKAQHLREMVKLLYEERKLPDRWDVDMAAMLAYVGFAAIPSEITRKVDEGQKLENLELEILESVPEVGHNLLRRIPRLNGVAQIILYSRKDYSGRGFPQKALKEAAIPLGARILRLLSDLLQLDLEGVPREIGFQMLSDRSGVYDPTLLEMVRNCPAFAVCLSRQRSEESAEEQWLKPEELKTGDVLVEDIRSLHGELLIASGLTLSESMVERIKNLARIKRIREAVRVHRDAGATAAVMLAV